jgi:hypothetical protein
MTNNSNQLVRFSAYCRELQRERGAGHIIKIPLHKVKKHLRLRTPRQAQHLLSTLEDAGILQCVRHGIGHIPQQQGYPSLWRYKAPLVPNFNPTRPKLKGTNQ